MTLAVAAPLLCVFAFLMAAVEIEIEGPYGWAQNLPTPYRVSGPLARAFGAALGGKPLTGYNLLIFTATLVAFHLPFAFGTAWTAVAELTVLAAWVAWSALWDFLWFLLNPAYGWRLFLPGSVWWHARWLWRLPLDYWVASGASLLLAFLAQALAWGGAGRRVPRSLRRPGPAARRVHRVGRGRRPGLAALRAPVPAHARGRVRRAGPRPHHPAAGSLPARGVRPRRGRAALAGVTAPAGSAAGGRRAPAAGQHTGMSAQVPGCSSHVRSCPRSSHATTP